MEKLRAEWDLLDRETLRRKQGQKLHWYLKNKVVPNAAYYRELFQRHKIDPDEIRTLEDLARIPFTTKANLSPTFDHPDRPRDFIMIPDGEKLKRQPGLLIEALFKGRAEVQGELLDEFKPIFLTSTTGRSAEPVPFVFTKHDIEILRDAGQRMVWVLGAQSDSKIMNMFPFAPHLAFWQTHYACTAADVFCISTGGGKTLGTDGNIRMIERVKPSTLIGMPTFIYHVLQQALEEKKSFPFLTQLVFGGEKVPAGMLTKLDDLAHRLGAGSLAMVATYGFTEAKMAWGECPFPINGPSSGYHVYPDLGIVEIVDVETGEPLPDHTPGEIVYTALDSRGSVVIRYRTGDTTDMGLTHEPCPHCGRRCPRILGHISRRSEFRQLDIGKVKGTLVDFNQLEHVLDDMPMVSSWQLELRKRNDDPLDVDELILHAVSASPEIAGQSFKDKVGTEFAARTEIHPNRVEIYTSEQMRDRHGVGRELKEKRVVDNRPKPNG